ncbi:MAG: hypothetical protein U1E53_09760 [Dongiaceae bacterium]
MADPQGDERRSPQTQFSDPAHNGADPGRDSMEASLAEMERARSANAAPSQEEGGEEHGGQEGGIGETLRGAAETTRRTAERAAGTARETAGQAAEATREAAEQLGGQARDMAGQAYQAGQEAVREVGRRAAEQPWVAVGVGFAVGYLLAWLIHGERRWS